MKAVCCIIAGIKKDLEQHDFRAIVDHFIHKDEGDDIFESYWSHRHLVLSLKVGGEHRKVPEGPDNALEKCRAGLFELLLQPWQIKTVPSLFLISSQNQRR